MTWTIRRIAPGQHVRMPWRNGQGSTAEIARGSFVPGAGFDWRLSIADIAAAAPFSAFEGYDRVLLVIEGAGMVLTGADGIDHRLRQWDGVAFPGEDALACRLIDGPTRDLNLMVRRRAARFTAGLAPPDEPVGPEPGCALFAAVLLRGTARCGDAQMQVGDTLLAEAATPGAALVLMRSDDALLFQASLHTLRRR